MAAIRVPVDLEGVLIVLTIIDATASFAIWS
jgi:hypothetical protein